MKPFLTPRWLLPIGGLITGLVVIILVAPAVLPHTFAGTVIQSPQTAYDFSLPSTTGQDLKLSDLRGKAVLLFFGYMTCPDVCPATLGELRLMLDALGGRASQTQVVMVTVDPERDSLDKLKRHLSIFNESMIGLSGDLTKTEQIATRYGVYFKKRILDADGRYLVDHTATVMLIDPKGYLRVIYPFGTPGKAFADDVAYILTH